MGNRLRTDKTHFQKIEFIFIYTLFKSKEEINSQTFCYSGPRRSLRSIDAFLRCNIKYRTRRYCHGRRLSTVSWKDFDKSSINPRQSRRYLQDSLESRSTGQRSGSSNPSFQDFCFRSWSPVSTINFDHDRAI